MASRYGSRSFIFNNNEEYRKAFFNDRGISEIVQYETADFSYPTLDEMDSLSTITIRWSATSKLYNLSSEYYGSPTYWWVIALYNKKPTEAEFKIGDVVYVPLPLDVILGYYGV
jgi:hypothetical protein